MDEKFSLRFVPLSRDACSCGTCFARNVNAGEKQAADIYELRVGHTVIRLCSSCLHDLKQTLEQPLPDGEIQIRQPDEAINTVLYEAGPGNGGGTIV